jgi:excisionase family DNA binding protein
VTKFIVLSDEELEALLEQAAARAVEQVRQRRWLTAEQAAEHLGVSPKTIHNLTGPNAEHRIPCHRLTPGGEKRFDRLELDDHLRRRT